jgi:hypothetical protein
MRIRYNEEATALPFSVVMDAINRLKYGNIIRVWLQILLQTGARISETDRMYYNPTSYGGIYGNKLVWIPGKNQNQQRPRTEKLSLKTIEELNYMRSKERCSNRLFPVSYQTLRRRFNALRWVIGWTEKVKGVIGARQSTYRYQLKGIRKLFATKTFWEYYEEYNHDANASILLTSKRMRHSSGHITVTHYFSENKEELEIYKFLNIPMCEIIDLYYQSKLTDFQFIDKNKIIHDNNQTRMFQF